ncbi:hypothetical protein BGX38DRAFT_1192856 [Terfezia claveryi]|nr:hypothetical protein BGX38DRAFT_1192856 [Terfezia claveryi]
MYHAHSMPTLTCTQLRKVINILLLLRAIVHATSHGHRPLQICLLPRHRRPLQPHNHHRYRNDYHNRLRRLFYLHFHNKPQSFETETGETGETRPCCSAGSASGR